MHLLLTLISNHFDSWHHHSLHGNMSIVLLWCIIMCWHKTSIRPMCRGIRWEATHWFQRDHKHNNWGKGRGLGCSREGERWWKGSFSKCIDFELKNDVPWQMTCMRHWMFNVLCSFYSHQNCACICVLTSYCYMLTDLVAWLSFSLIQR